jgi:hypothetical protein
MQKLHDRANILEEMKRSSMGTPNNTIQPLSSDRNQYMQQAAKRWLQRLEEFSGDHLDYGPKALQLLDEWIDRQHRNGSLSTAERAMVVAFLGQTFLQAHGGYWATQTRDPRPKLGVVCPIATSKEDDRFIDIVGQIDRRMSNGIVDSLNFFFLTTSVDLQGRS